jgi:DNA polymerase-3 subunit gamma/tau
MTWRKFAFKMRDEGQDTLFTALTGRDPILKEENAVTHYVDNDVQLRFLQTNETKLMGYLRKELQNWSISLTIEEGSEENGEKKLYSGKEKFEDMAERNPHLKTLRQKFKLDIDF